jgi:hypothetical protein
MSSKTNIAANTAQQDSPAEMWGFRILTTLAVIGVVWRLVYLLST